MDGCVKPNFWAMYSLETLQKDAAFTDVKIILSYFFDYFTDRVFAKY